jgi:hypothetical protein
MSEWLQSDREIPCKIGFDWYLTPPSNCPEVISTFRASLCRRTGKSVLRTLVDDLQCSHAASTARPVTSLLLGSSALLLVAAVLGHR